MKTALNNNSRLGGLRAGLIVPSVNTTIEPEFGKLGPPGLSFHAARINLTETTVSGLEGMNQELIGAVKLVAATNPDVLVYACTSGSFFAGRDGMTELTDKIRREVQCPIITTSDAAIAALQIVGVRKIAVATPYIDELNERERAFFEGYGLSVVSLRGLSLSGPAIREVPPETIVDLALETDCEQADALFISCTDFRALETVDHLENRLKKPVITSNQATLWATLRELRINAQIPGHGRLLEAR